MLDGAQRKTILKFAREVIAEAFGRGRAAVPPAEGPFALPGGAFVTLTEGGDLRGCIGRMNSPDPLVDTIRSMAKAAAFEDPRFEPLEEAELDRVSIEISILTPLRKIPDWHEVEVGKHGVYLQNGYRSGVFLPQVPVEWGWDRDTYLKQLCRKAGMSEAALSDPYSEFFVFEAEVFSEAGD